MDYQKYSLDLPEDMRPVVLIEDESTLDVYIAMAKAVARTTYQSLYIIDYCTMSFLYVSTNPLFLCGQTPEEVKEQGYNFYMNNVPEEDLGFLAEINHAGFKFFAQTPVHARLLCTISYSFYLKVNKGGSSLKILINHQLTPLSLDSGGNIHLALCVVSLAHTDKPYSAYITMEGHPVRWEYFSNEKRWKKVSKTTLTENEKLVISLSRQGVTIEGIAAAMYKSIDSIKGYRKDLFQKLGVSNISEAIAYAIHHRLI